MAVIQFELDQFQRRPLLVQELGSRRAMKPDSFWQASLVHTGFAETSATRAGGPHFEVQSGGLGGISAQSPFL